VFIGPSAGDQLEVKGSSDDIISPLNWSCREPPLPTAAVGNHLALPFKPVGGKHIFVGNRQLGVSISDHLSHQLERPNEFCHPFRALGLAVTQAYYRLLALIEAYLPVRRIDRVAEGPNI
jgi:hypothetical protein